MGWVVKSIRLAHLTSRSVIYEQLDAPSSIWPSGASSVRELLLTYRLVRCPQPPRHYQSRKHIVAYTRPVLACTTYQPNLLSWLCMPVRRKHRHCVYLLNCSAAILRIIALKMILFSEIMARSPARAHAAATDTPIHTHRLGASARTVVPGAALRLDRCVQFYTRASITHDPYGSFLPGMERIKPAFFSYSPRPCFKSD